MLFADLLWTFEAREKVKVEAFLIFKLIDPLEKNRLIFGFTSQLLFTHTSALLHVKARPC